MQVSKEYRPPRRRRANPPDNMPDAKRNVAQSLYTLVMNVAEAASEGEMPSGGHDGLTYLTCMNIADTIVSLMNVNAMVMTGAEVKARFERDAAEWKEKTEYLSTVLDMSMEPSYQRIIGLGPAVVPLIIERLREDPDHWFWALVAIVGEDKAAGATTLDEAARRWIEWYDSAHSS